MEKMENSSLLLLMTGVYGVHQWLEIQEVSSYPKVIYSPAEIV
jgi:hypothetical protein